MAAIGQSLASPEIGWKRYDNLHEKIRYIGNWASSSNDSYYNGAIQYTDDLDGKIEFEFYGTKLTLMNVAYSNRSTNIEVIIDGVSQGVFSQYNPSAKYKHVFFTVENLNKKNHVVIIKNGSARLDLDCVDIDDNGFIGINPQKKMVLKNTTTNHHYSLEEKILIHLPDNSDKNMILHGIEQGKEIQLDVPFTNIQYIQDTSGALGSGKVFTHEVDLNEIKAKKLNI